LEPGPEEGALRRPGRRSTKGHSLRPAKNTFAMISSASADSRIQWHGCWRLHRGGGAPRRAPGDTRWDGSLVGGRPEPSRTAFLRCRYLQIAKAMPGLALQGKGKGRTSNKRQTSVKIASRGGKTYHIERPFRTAPAASVPRNPTLSAIRHCPALQRPLALPRPVRMNILLEGGAPASPVASGDGEVPHSSAGGKVRYMRARRVHLRKRGGEVTYASAALTISFASDWICLRCASPLKLSA
jgi:hypothetical protein